MSHDHDPARPVPVPERESAVNPEGETTAPADDENPVESVVLLSPAGEPIGAEPKATVHRTAAQGGTPLHLAFSAHVYGPDGRFLLTRRALGKAAFGGVWTNGYCGHPGAGESPAAAVERRAPQELGVTVGDVQPLLPHFRYRAQDAAGVEENEVCPVFRVRLDGDPAPLPEEVADWMWVEVADLVQALEALPGAFSPWLVDQMQQGAFAGR